MFSNAGGEGGFPRSSRFSTQHTNQENPRTDTSSCAFSTTQGEFNKRFGDKFSHSQGSTHSIKEQIRWGFARLLPCILTYS